MATMTIQYNPASTIVRPVIELLQQMKGIKIISRSDSKVPKATYETYDDVPVELRRQIEQAREEYERGETIVCHSHEEMHKFFDSL